MKLLRYGPAGEERPGLLDRGGVIRDLGAVIKDIDAAALSDLKWLQAIDPSNLPAIDGNPRLGPCVGKPGKFLCIGLNYSDHAAEAGMPIPIEPIVFMKATSAICGPNDDIIIPLSSQKSDWEVELGIVIGKECRYLPNEAAAESVIAGYCIINDLSEREWR